MHTIYRYRWAVGLAFTALSLPVLAWSQVNTAPLAGTVEATFDHDEASGAWTLHVNGTFSGTDAAVTDMSIYGMDASSTPLGIEALWPSLIAKLPTASPFSETIQIPKPDPDWSELGVILTLSNGHQTLQVRSSLFPVIWHQPILIDHAFGSAVLSAPNYARGDIPDGIGIPHTLINSVPAGDYYAVVFFEGLGGCPSDNYEINAFIPNRYWGYDIRGPLAPYAKAAGSVGGGCMQKFHIDPAKDDTWLWGALSNTGTSSAIADANGIPAFAICATAAACDPIIPHAATSVPEDASTTATKVSNVLFLPGMKGSRLYEDNPLCLIPSDSCGIPLWLPIADAAVPELFLDATGKSVRNVFVKESGLLGSAFGQRFYDSFTEELGATKDDGSFGSGWNWRAIAYDWRLSLPDIIHAGTKHGNHIYFGEASATPYIKQELQQLASSSPTGRVTIIAHSNGGLVAKALMDSLGDLLATQLIDKVIFVGVPQSGAPRALGALLYGDEEGIPGIAHMPNIILSEAHAREFGRNSPMAYHLLPSAAYLAAKQPAHPLVQFEAGDLLSKERMAYGPTIDTPAELQSFALAEEGGRSMPAKDNLTSANVLNANLLSYATNEHTRLDAWRAPPGIEVYQLGGYGVPTISGIDLYQADHKSGPPTLSYRPLFTEDGDGTVPVISSLLMNASAHVHQLWIDLSNMRDGTLTYSHGNLFEADDIQETIKALLRGTNAFPATVHAMDVSALASAQKRLAFYVHSPVSLSVTDAAGNESKVAEDGSAEAVPGSIAGTLGEVKYVVVPATDAPYTLTLAGEGNGTFTLDMQEVDADTVTASSTIADVPVTSTTRAMLTVADSLETASALSIDEDDDGTIDTSVSPVLGATVFPEEHGESDRAKPHAAVHGVQKLVTHPLAHDASTTPAAEVAHDSPVLEAKDSSAQSISNLEQSQFVPQVAGTSTTMRDTPAISLRREPLLERILSWIRNLLRTLLRAL